MPLRAHDPEIERMPRVLLPPFTYVKHNAGQSELPHQGGPHPAQKNKQEQPMNPNKRYNRTLHGRLIILIHCLKHTRTSTPEEDALPNPKGSRQRICQPHPERSHPGKPLPKACPEHTEDQSRGNAPPQPAKNQPSSARARPARQNLTGVYARNDVRATYWKMLENARNVPWTHTVAPYEPLSRRQRHAPDWNTPNPNQRKAPSDLTQN